MSSKLFLPSDFIITPIEFFPVQSDLLESSDFEEGSISDGYGQQSGVAIELTRGATVDLEVNLNLRTLSIESFNEWKREIESFTSEEEREFLEERWGGSGKASGFFGAVFGLRARGNAYHYKNKTNEKFVMSNERAKGFSESVYNLDTNDFNVTGNVKATGTSNIPTRVGIFFRVTTITFADNKKLTVIDTDNPVAADATTGDTSRVDTEPTTLNIIPV